MTPSTHYSHFKDMSLQSAILFDTINQTRKSRKKACKKQYKIHEHEQAPVKTNSK